MMNSLFIITSKYTLIIFWVLILGGCSPELSDPANRTLQNIVLKSPYGVATDTDILQLPLEAKNLLAKRIPKYLPVKIRFERLVKLFNEPQHLALHYQHDTTLSVTDTFAQKRGNCLSFTQLFLAMARELNITARFQEIQIPPNWHRTEDILTLYNHIVVFVRFGEKVFHVDFGDVRTPSKTSGRIVTDTEARGMYFNNLGVKSLKRGAVEEAVRLFNRALILAPKMSFIWSNLGVSLLRLNLITEGQNAFEESLLLNPNQPTALANLNNFFVTNKSGDELRENLRKKLIRHQNRNPYYHYNLGKSALSNKSYALARKHFNKAIRYKKDEPFFHYDLAQSWLYLGQPRKALRSYKLAQSLTTDRDQQLQFKTQFKGSIRNSLNPKNSTESG